MNEIKRNLDEPVKIYDVANMAGVSITTVSRVLNGSDQVSKKTTKKVMQAIETLGYVPNEMARGLVTNSNRIVGVLIPNILNGYYAEIITHMEPLISARGYSLQLCITNSEREKIAYYMEDLLRKRAVGVIILSAIIESNDLIRRASERIAIVAIEGEMSGVDQVCLENERGMYLVVEHLIKHGHTRIGFAGYHYQYPSLAERVKGYRRAHADYGLAVDESLILDEVGSKNPGYDAAMKFLAMEQPPTAIQCMNEYCAHGVYLALMEHGVRIPEDISVSAFDGQANMKVLSPRLTTAAMPIAQMAAAAVELVLQRINHTAGPATHLITFPLHLEEGKSVKALDTKN